MKTTKQIEHVELVYKKMGVKGLSNIINSKSWTDLQKIYAFALKTKAVIKAAVR